MRRTVQVSKTPQLQKKLKTTRTLIEIVTSFSGGVEQVNIAGQIYFKKYLGNQKLLGF